MKNHKLKLDELKVQSFVTDFDKEQGQTQEVNGGASLHYCLNTFLFPCNGPWITTTKTNSLVAVTCNYALCFTDNITSKLTTSFPEPTTSVDPGIIKF